MVLLLVSEEREAFDFTEYFGKICCSFGLSDFELIVNNLHNLMLIICNNM